jgi:poly(ADP-ribose) glycohydrolase
LRWQNGIVEAVDGRVLLAIDAEDYRKREHQQYHHKAVTREVKKAMLGFAATPALPAYEVVTGNWGCGVFKGDIQLKFLIQWVAAAFSRRNVRYLTWDKRELEGLEGWISFFSRFPSNKMLKALLDLKPPGKAVFEQMKDMLMRER